VTDEPPGKDPRPSGRLSRWHSLQAKLALLIIVLVLGTAVALLSWGYRDYSRTALAYQLREMEVLGSAAAARITQLARVAERQVTALSRDAGLRAAVREAIRGRDDAARLYVAGELRDLLGADPAFGSLQLYDVSGLPVVGLVRRDGAIRRHLEAYAFTREPEALELARRAPIGATRLIGPIVDADDEHALCLHIAVPVMDTRGVRIGVVFAEYALDSVLEEVRQETRARLDGIAASVSLVDLYDRSVGDGFAIEAASSVRDRLARTTGLSGSDWMALAGRQLAVAATGFASLSPDPGRYSFVALTVPRDHLLQRVWASFLGRLLAAVALALGALLVALVYARSLARPLGQLLEATQRFGAGRRVGVLPTARSDEVGRLSAAFARMMRQGQERSADLEREIARRERTEEELREQVRSREASEARYRALYESVAAGVCRTDEAGNVLSANPACVRLMGYESEEELRRGVRVADVWAGPGTREEHLRTVRREGEVAGIEFGLRRKDGHIVWVFGNVRAIWDDAGEVVAYETTVIDITDRKRAEQARQASELRFKRLSDSSIIGVAFGSLSSGMLTEANAYTLRLLQRGPEDLPLPVADVLTESWSELERRLRAAGGARQPIEPLEKSLRRGDGSTVPVLVNVALLDPDRDEFVAVIVDRTAAVASLRRARELKEFFQLVLDSVPMRIAYVDVDLRVRYFNRAYRDWFGWSDEKVDGRLLVDVIGQERFDAALPEMKRALAGQQRRYEVAVERDGRTHHADVLYVPHRDGQGRVLGFFSVVHDVTEARELEARLRQAQKLEALGQLTGGIAHDFNNLLSVVIGNLQLYERQAQPDARSRRSLDAALRAATRGADLTRRLLSFSRRQPLELRAVDLAEQVRQMREMVGSTLGAGITVRTDLAPDLWPVAMDAGQFEHALLNLVINARDAMEEGGELVIRARNVLLAAGDLGPDEQVGPGEYVEVDISDSGQGMTADVLSRAFEPFYTTKPTGNGSGLGLAMVYGFVRQTRGLVRLRSRPGEGTTVEMLFPRWTGAVPTTVAGAAPVGGIVEGAETVLVVDDDPDLREQACNALAARGYRTIEAPDGPAALALLDLHPEVGLLFTDILMPGDLTGLELAAEARRRQPGVGILLATGFADARELRRRGIDAGDALWKPYSPEELARRVREALDARESRESGTKFA